MDVVTFLFLATSDMYCIDVLYHMSFETIFY